MKILTRVGTDSNHKYIEKKYSHNDYEEIIRYVIVNDNGQAIDNGTKRVGSVKAKLSELSGYTIMGACFIKE